MESCNYHPTTPSAFYCDDCQMGLCTHCVDHSVGGEALCFRCGSHVQTRVTADNVDPFWRRLEKAFKYPMNSNALMMIVGLSVLSTIVASLPFPGLVMLILMLIIAGATVNYSFMCLTATSEGDLTPPKLADAFSNSLGVLWKLFLLSLLAGGGVWAIAVYASPILAIVAMIVLFVGIPAILMCFATTNSVIESINPVNFVRVMTAVGLPYLVLVMFLFIMISSVGILNNIIGNDLAALSTILQSSVSNYYAVVSFHLMGYMLYQYQDRLGFSSVDDEELLQIAEPQDVILSHVNICLKEGEYTKAIDLLKGGITSHPRQNVLHQRLFELLYRLENKQEMKEFADSFLAFGVKTARSDLMLSDYRKIKQLIPIFLPKDPYVRLQLANAAHAQGDAISTVQLINGMHKQHPTFEKLVAAYQLMATALGEMPNMAAKAEQCRAMVKALMKKHPEQDAKVGSATKSVYEVKEPEQIKVQKEEATPEQTAQPEADTKVHAPIEFKL